MGELVLLLCTAVVKTAFKLWTGDNALADEVSGDLTDLIKGRVSSALDQRKVRRRFEQMEEIVGDQITSMLNSEFRDLAEGERNAAIAAVTETINRAQLTDRVLFAANLDPFYLEKHVRRFTGDATRDLSWGGVQLYDRVLAQCCAYIIEIADKLPKFQVGAFTELLRRDTQILARLGDVLERLPVPANEDSAPDRVEIAYRQRIVKLFDRLELFGLDFAAQWYALSIAYVNLKVSVPPATGHGTRELESSRYVGETFEHWLAKYPRLVIDGRAGSGKTTILQWIAVRAARGDFAGPAAPFNGHVPFFLRLREYAGGSLPAPEQFLAKVAPLLAPEAPSWPREQLRTGRAFVLVDGLDEVSEAQRAAVLAWLRELTDLFPEARYVVTTRPGAIEDNALADVSFRGAVLDPMDRLLVREFIEHWHTAMREWQQDAQAAGQLAACRDELVKTLDTDRFLSELANTPLLAGLICALNQHLNAQLPRRRGEIFEKALGMFYERDRKRGIPPIVQLDQSATYHLLGDLALWMVRNAAIEVTDDTAQGILQRSSASLPDGPHGGPELYRHLLLRSGLLRELTAGHVDFVHRTFQEYLAAKALIADDNVGEIVKNASDDQWREVVILAAGQANTKQATDLLRGLLRPAVRSRQRNQRRLLAVASLNEIHGADRDVLETIDRVVPELLPPRTFAQAEAFSHAGDRLLPHLAKIKSFRNGQEAAATIRTAALIGGPGALDLISGIMSEHRSKWPERIEAECAESWSSFSADADLYAEMVLKTAGIRRFRISDERLLAALARTHIDVDTLELFGLVHEGTDLSALDGIQPRELKIIVGSARSLTGVLRSWQSVKELELSFIMPLEDASSVTLLPNLERVRIIYCQNLTDLTPFARLDKLETLRLDASFNIIASPTGISERLIVSRKPPIDLSAFADKDIRLEIDKVLRIADPPSGFRPSLVRF